MLRHLLQMFSVDFVLHGEGGANSHKKSVFLYAVLLPSQDREFRISVDEIKDYKKESVRKENNALYQIKELTLHVRVFLHNLFELKVASSKPSTLESGVARPSTHATLKT